MDGRRGSPSRAGSAEKTRLEREVGMVIHTVSDKDYKIELYVVDLDAAAFEEEREEYALVEPSVRFLFPKPIETLFAICVVESSVYIFGGYDPCPQDPPYPKVKYARKFDLSSDKVAADLQVMEDELAKIPKMKHAKCFPRAIPTPDGDRILVFSSYIPAKIFNGAFELYDPRNNSWEVLPDLPFSYHQSCSFMPAFRLTDSESKSDSEEGYCSCFTRITSYSFLDASHFFVETNKGKFALDMENKKWTSLGNGYHGKGLIPGQDYFVRAKGDEDDGAITSDMLYVIKDGGFLSKRATAFGYDLPLSAFSPPRSLFPEDLFGAVVPLPLHQGEEERVCNTCIVQLEVNESGNDTRILIDVCRTELHTLSTEVSKHLKLRTNSPLFISAFNLVSF